MWKDSVPCPAVYVLPAFDPAGQDLSCWVPLTPFLGLPARTARPRSAPLCDFSSEPPSNRPLVNCHIC